MEARKGNSPDGQGEGGGVGGEEKRRLQSAPGMGEARRGDDAGPAAGSR